MINNPSAPTEFVDIANARVEEQRQVMKKIIADGDCPFCMENLKKYHPEPIIKETDHWLLTENAWPYENTKHHLLAISKTHFENLVGFTPEIGTDLTQLLAWVEKEYQVPGGGIAIRFGDTNYSAGTVLHLHVQFIVPDIDKPDFEPVRFKIGKNKERRNNA